MGADLFYGDREWKFYCPYSRLFSRLFCFCKSLVETRRGARLHFKKLSILKSFFRRMTITAWVILDCKCNMGFMLQGCLVDDSPRTKGSSLLSLKLHCVFIFLFISTVNSIRHLD